MRTPGLAEFPDAKTARGAKHLTELCTMVEQGHRAVMLYLVQRQDCDRFTIADDIDPTYAAAYAEAMRKGVEVVCYHCHISIDEVTVAGALPVVFS